MTLYLYLQVKPLEKVKFGSYLVEALQNLSLELNAIDLDSHSESFVVTKATEAISKAEKLILHLDVIDNEPVGSIGIIFETIRRNRQPLLCIREGVHHNIDKMLKLSGTAPHEVDSKASAIELISDFLTTQS
ncbi:hypothetical protein BFP97_10540 [Roseivirga sp. 4D4]|uniref:hypothetical protein n=1 Tax=Roseivirga sp. 4D4 TaxID=1889784 RepID=UPI000852AFA1|nr:hypothetical protein [Roseivirga sp. 4D4]OEK01926.1 hypothetical protein BFP97_10540 [Roseivirga sp. 4D4]